MSIATKLKAKLDASGKDTSGLHTIVDMLKKVITDAGGDTDGIQTIEEAVLILDFSGGSGQSSVERKDVNFFDYDGTLLYSYTADEFLGMSALPTNPSHSGLTAQGWNWSLSDAQSYVTKYGKLNIGQMYVTDDGKTRFYIHFDADVPANRRVISIGLQSSVADNVTVDWGDGTTETVGSVTATEIEHTYTSTGDYVATLTVNSGDIQLTHGASFVGLGMWIGLNKVECGRGLIAISDDAFRNCRNLSSVTIPDGVTSIANYAFSNCAGLSSVTIPDSVTNIGENAFGGCASLSSVTIPDSVTSIDAFTFNCCYSLSSVTIPDSVTSISDNVFFDCYSLSSVTIPDSVTSIGNYVFSACYSLLSITIPDSVTSIGKDAFSECTSLSSVTIPDGVTSIGDRAFSYCDTVSEYHLLPTTPPTLSRSTAFSGIASDCIIYVPEGTLEAYQTATNWETYASYMREES